MFIFPLENFSTASKKYVSAFLNPFIIAYLGFSGNSGSLIMNWCKLSLKKSAQEYPPCPSKTPKNAHFGQFSHFLLGGFIMLRIIETLSSL